MSTINEEYWLKQGFSLIDGGLARVYGHIKNLGTYMTGLTGIYGAATISEAILLEITEWWQFTILALPILILYIGKWYAEITKIPKLKEFYVQSPEFCREAYYSYLNDAEKQLHTLRKVTFLTTASMVMALLFTIYFETSVLAKADKKKTENLDSYYFNVKTWEDNTHYALEGLMPKEKIILLTVYYKDSIVSEKQILIPQHGILQFQDTIKTEKSERRHLKFQVEFDKSTEEKKIIIKKLKNDISSKNSELVPDILMVSMKEILDSI